MKITDSTVAMSSAHKESSHSYKESITMEAAASKDLVGVILSISKEASGKSYMESMEEFKQRQQEDTKQRQKNNDSRALNEMARAMQTNQGNNFELPDVDAKIKMLRQILAALRGEKLPPDFWKEEKADNNKCLDLRSKEYRAFEGFSIKSENVMQLQMAPLTTNSGTLWQRVTAISGFSVETEATTFASKGMVNTADGRSIVFNIEVSMSRAFMSEINMIESTQYIKTDPLIINLDSDIASVTDQKFLFDLDSDGKEESISFAGRGSGFLALDKNGDGKINDGSELFGTKSGDGFRDLAAFDEDGNGWIDENDSVFSKLRVWTKDANGKDCLLSLKQSDVGAIYLGNANTQFSLKDDNNSLNGEIKKTGIYLKEKSGSVGTINHVDLVV